ncbi:hypothetical protein WSS_A21968 [Rhodococcus opacus M213]|uniref:Uncharacterized protein n=1 Tax=Rhodococcus opacus M213 TaxID=1129896 RepID=K8XI78_RHOOP|nr:hypothetical protein [Rhodococcus opacus]EKT80486.1 hypothetical protein WSS_A21968 [Rhodococcus opacus M213]
MIELLIVLVGMIGSGLIMLIGFVWRRRRQLIAIASIAIIAAVVLLWQQRAPSDEQRQPVLAHMEVLNWGERDTTYMNDETGQIGPGRIVYASVSITAGDTAISIPDVNSPAPQYKVWLALANTGRVALGAQTSQNLSGAPLLWLPSHEDELVSEFGAEPFPIPGASCANLQPQQSCQITLVWYLMEHGVAPQIHGLILQSVSEPLAVDHASANGMFVQWPALTPEPTCSGDMAVFCGNSPNP